MKILLYLLSVILLSSLSSCDPVHTLTLENSSNQTIEVCYYPSLELTQIGTKVVERIIIRGKEMDKVTLDSAETIQIGTVVAKYTPSASDIDLDYLQIRYGQDTIILSGKKAILSAIQKVEKLNWRLIVK